MKNSDKIKTILTILDEYYSCHETSDSWSLSYTRETKCRCCDKILEDHDFPILCTRCYLYMCDQVIRSFPHFSGWFWKDIFKEFTVEEIYKSILTRSLSGG